MAILRDEKIVRALEKAKSAHPELAYLLEAQAELLEAQQAVKQALPVFSDATLSAENIETRLSKGQNLISFDALQIDWPQFERLWRQADSIARRVRRDWGDAASPVAESGSVQAWYNGDTLERDERQAFLLTAALAPFLARAAEWTRPHIRQDLWRRGNCPVCAGKPDLAVLDQESGARHLICSRCDTQWLFQRFECPYCGNGDQEKLAYYTGDAPDYRLYVCEVCHGYLKTIDLRERGDKVVPCIERVVTIGMDVSAREEGYC